MIIALQTLVFFRQSLLSCLERLLSPYYSRFTLKFARGSDTDEEEDEEVYAEFDDHKGVVFYPPMYAQRYAAVSDCLMDERWCGKLEKVVDLGHHDISFINYLKEVPGVSKILGVDIESVPLRCSSDLLVFDEYPLRESPLQVTLFQGNAADPDYRLIGCDAVVAIEMIEHMLPHDLDRLVHTVFGFIKPWVAVITTPNADFNVLFKNLEKNGLRRLDHFFEWNREQFHDWCSNIVVRYPQYTVTCKGVGPGPAGTHHLGCCSQLALFINKNYHKQPDLNLNSLALVTKMPSSQNIVDVFGWDSENDLLHQQEMLHQEKIESLTDFINTKQSYMTIVITSSSSFSIEPLEFSDKTSQCNIDYEVGKNFLMINEEDLCLKFVVPRRTFESRVYEIEDVNSRLNCTTFSVKKFSKQTQNMMAKNKIDSMVRTREVVDEIQNLTRILNSNKHELDSKQADNGKQIWCNINWGDNAPYWNQYYKVVRDYNYPYQPKSEECRILDAISEEINRLIDLQSERSHSTEPSKELISDSEKFVIPIEHLMEVVKHITDDVHLVTDLLEWNGYEVQGDAVVYSRLAVDHRSLDSVDDDWIGNDTESEYATTEVRSTTLSDGSTIVPECIGRDFRWALAKKLQTLRAMLSADEDITTELDRVVCRLMKLALCTSKGKDTPRPAKWMQCKLLDLLTLTEKAIERRKKHHLENCNFNFFALCNKQKEDWLMLQEMSKANEKVRNIVEKYDIDERDKMEDYNMFVYDVDGLDRDVASNESLKDFEFSDSVFSHNENAAFETNRKISEFNFGADTTETWVGKDMIEVVSYPEQKLTPSDNSTSNGEICAYRKKHKNFSTCPKIQENADRKSRKRVYGKTDNEDCKRSKRSKTNIKNMKRNKSNTNGFVRNYKKKLPYNDVEGYRVKPKRKIKAHKILQSTASKPIPGSLIELCHPQFPQPDAKSEHFANDTETNSHKNVEYSNIAAPEETVLISIVMNDVEETVALCRSVGTDADSMNVENEIILGRIDNEETNDFTVESELQVKTENVQSQTIFLNDINEPSTSKGVRHVSMDAQCGTDPMNTSYPRPSPISSLTKLPSVFETGIMISDSLKNIKSMTADNGTVKRLEDDLSQSSNLKCALLGESTTNVFRQNSCNFGTCTKFDDYKCGRPIRSPTKRSVGIKIKDSVSDMKKCADEENEQISSLRSKFPKRGKGITIRDSCTDMSTGIHFDFATVTNVCAQKNKTIATRKKSPIMTFEDKVTLGVGTSGSSTKIFEFRTNARDKHKAKNEHNNKKILENLTVTVQCQSNLNVIEIPTVKSPKPECLESSTGTEISSQRLSRNSPNKQSFGFKIKKDDGSISKSVEYAATRVELLDSPSFVLPVFPIHNFKSATESKFTDSGSEFLNCSGCSSCLNASDFEKKFPKKEVVKLPTQSGSLLGKLSCGGLHIHSYKEKQISEDIVFQGEWQRNSLKWKEHTNKRSLVSTSAKMRLELTASKKRVSGKAKPRGKFCDNRVRRVESKKLEKSQNSTQPLKILSKSDPAKQKSTQGSVKTTARKTGLCKVSSKITVSSMASKAPRNARPTKRTFQPQTQNKVAFGRGNSVDSADKQSRIRNRRFSNNNKLDNGLTKAGNIIKINKEKPVSVVNPMMSKTDGLVALSTPKPKTEDINKNLTKLCDEPRNLTYLVFRNELENNPKKSNNNEPIDYSKTQSTSRKRNTLRRSSSPISQNSSTCSTPDSVATVKEAATRTKSNARKYCGHSPSSIICTDNNDTVTVSPARIRKYNKRYKIVKKSEENKDKENAPETSNKLSNDDNPQKVKSAFMGRNQNVFIAKVPNNESSLHQLLNKSKIPTLDKGVEKRKPEHSNIIMKKSVIHDSFDQSNENGNDPSKVVFVRGSHLDNRDQNDPKPPSLDRDSTLLKEWVAISERSVDNDVCSENSEKFVKRMLEDRLDFISMPDVDAEKSQEDSSFEKELDETSSLKSFKTVIDSADNAHNENTDVVIDGFFMSAHEIVIGNEKEFDLVSYQSSVSTKSSEYFGADGFEHTESNVVIHNTNSVRGIFERKERLPSIPAGMLAVQAFSGFSMDAEPVIGDQPDYINLIDSYDGSLDVGRQANPGGVLEIQGPGDSNQFVDSHAGQNPDPVNVVDSETGSVATNASLQTWTKSKENATTSASCRLEIPDPVNMVDSETGSILDCHRNRLTSEELFVSGRSSDSYESCLIDEDAVVPNWLFNIINQPYTNEVEDQQPLIGPLPAPRGEPLYDLNGNTTEAGLGVGAGAGAGDGRGMHSDHSRDSSGRGTSLSSSDASSGQQSEAILIDPSAFTAQFELMHDSIGSSVGVTTLVVPLDSRAEGAQSEILSTSRGPTRLLIPLVTISDGDADVSSLDTDVPDSSDC